ncbi:MAG: hypothetical protein NTU41_14745, partial [Chloroflexi bacterium]|nr:hypothetical protein [Chloroflexota bacterium]
VPAALQRNRITLASPTTTPGKVSRAAAMSMTTRIPGAQSLREKPTYRSHKGIRRCYPIPPAINLLADDRSALNHGPSFILDNEVTIFVKACQAAVMSSHRVRCLPGLSRHARHLAPDSVLSTSQQRLAGAIRSGAPDSQYRVGDP